MENIFNDFYQPNISARKYFYVILNKIVILRETSDTIRWIFAGNHMLGLWKKEDFDKEAFGHFWFFRNWSGCRWWIRVCWRLRMTLIRRKEKESSEYNELHGWGKMKCRLSNLKTTWKPGFYHPTQLSKTTDWYSCFQVSIIDHALLEQQLGTY